MDRCDRRRTDVESMMGDLLLSGKETEIRADEGKDVLWSCSTRKLRRKFHFPCLRVSRNKRFGRRLLPHNTKLRSQSKTRTHSLRLRCISVNIPTRRYRLWGKHLDCSNDVWSILSMKCLDFCSCWELYARPFSGHVDGHFEQTLSEILLLANATCKDF